jgi:Ca2+-binding EF-hand superfamily protein
MNGNASLPSALAAAAVLVLAACAHDPRPEEPSSYVGKRIQMQELDRNRDGFLTRDELDANHRLALEFATYDTDGDGRISDAEFLDYVEQTTD